MFNLIAIVFLTAASTAGDVYVIDHGLTERDCNERPVTTREIIDAVGQVPYDAILWCEPEE